MTAAAKHANARTDRRDYEQLLADADPTTIELDRRLRGLANTHGLTWKTTPRTRQFAGPHGSIIVVYPPADGINLLLAHIRDAGMDREADELLDHAAQFTHSRLAPAMPAIAASQVLEHWSDFTDALFPRLLELRARAHERR